MRHLASKDFWKCFQRLPVKIQDRANKSYEVLKHNPDHPSLHFKKVGRFRSVRVGLRYRALGGNKRSKATGENMTEGITVTRLLPNICTEKMEETRDFYMDLLGFVVGFEHKGWYIQMASSEKPELQIGIMRLGHEFAPQPYQLPAQGVILSVQVDDVEAAYSATKEHGFFIAHDLRDEEFGMRRFMVADPNGLLVNMFAFP